MSRLCWETYSCLYEYPLVPFVCSEHVTSTSLITEYEFSFSPFAEHGLSAVFHDPTTSGNFFQDMYCFPFMSRQ